MGDIEGFSKSGGVRNGTDDAEDKGTRNLWHNSLTMRRNAVIKWSGDNIETVIPSMNQSENTRNTENICMTVKHNGSMSRPATDVQKKTVR